MDEVVSVWNRDEWRVFERQDEITKGQNVLIAGKGRKVEKFKRWNAKES